MDNEEGQKLMEENATLRAELARLEAEVRRRGNIIAELQWRSSSTLGGMVVALNPGAAGRYSDGFGKR